MALVVDASVALARALPDESSVYADAVLTAVERDGLRVPDFGREEIANGLAVCLSPQAHHICREQAFLAALSHLRIDVEPSFRPDGHSKWNRRRRSTMALRLTIRHISILRRGKN